MRPRVSGRIGEAVGRRVFAPSIPSVPAVQRADAKVRKAVLCDGRGWYTQKLNIVIEASPHVERAPGPSDPCRDRPQSDHLAAPAFGQPRGVDRNRQLAHEALRDEGAGQASDGPGPTLPLLPDPRRLRREGEADGGIPESVLRHLSAGTPPVRGTVRHLCRKPLGKCHFSGRQRARGARRHGPLADRRGADPVHPRPEFDPGQAREDSGACVGSRCVAGVPEPGGWTR